MPRVTHDPYQVHGVSGSTVVIRWGEEEELIFRNLVELAPSSLESPIAAGLQAALQSLGNAEVDLPYRILLTLNGDA